MLTFSFALLSGLSMGYVLERGDLCFHSTLRGIFRRPKELDLLRAYLVMLLIVTPILALLRTLGWINPWIPPFNWAANISGGLVFGIGMVVASSCVTGLFYKLGHGMLGTAIGLLGWAVGDILVYEGPLAFLRERLLQLEISAQGESATLINLLGPLGWFLLLITAIGVLIWLYKAPRENRRQRGKLWGWLPLGALLSLVIVLAWLLAEANGFNYPYGTSYVPTEIFLALQGGEISTWIPVALLGLVPGSFVAARVGGTLWIRGEGVRRYLELGIGGLIMGIGAAIAGGCNLGHSMIGAPLLSLGSLTTTLSMAVGVFIAHRISLIRKMKSD
jgi:uncharacterized protein